jgi:hypothetical protein
MVGALSFVRGNEPAIAWVIAAWLILIFFMEFSSFAQVVLFIPECPGLP